MTSSSLFLDLPAELRNDIYEYATLEDQPFRLKSRLKVKRFRHLITTSAFILASHEVGEEYYAVLAKLALTTEIKILARVTDFNFRHVMRFINTELSTVQIAELGVHKRMIVELAIVTKNHLDPDNYSEWLRFCNSKSVSTGYTVNNSASGHHLHGADLMPWEEFGLEDREAVKIYLSPLDWGTYRRGGNSQQDQLDRMYADVVFLPHT